MKVRTVVMTGGGTAGHITPLLAVAKEVLKNDPSISIVYIGQRGDKNEGLIVNSGLPITIKRIFAGKYRRYPTQNLFQRIFYVKRHLLNLRDVLYTTLGFLQSLSLIIKIKPSVVFMKGGFVGVPVGLAAGLTGKKIVTHDSDALPGLANRLVSNFATIHAVANDSEYPYPKSKTRVVGIPVREEYYRYAKADGKFLSRKELGFSKDAKIIFIGGSTQGAKYIDDCIEKIVPSLLDKNLDLHIIQVFGRLNVSSMNSRYTDLKASNKERLHLHEFLHDNYRYMAAADILVGRAGATFIAEAGILSSACVIIPAPQLTGGHQVENAKLLESRKAAIVIEEKDLTPEKLELKLNELIKSKEKRAELGEALKVIQRPDAANKIADILVSI